MEYYYLKGDLAKKYNISNQTLIYYDNKGVLKPSYVHDNGYRYYNHMDIEKLEIILALKQSGMRLAEIKRLLHKETRSSLILRMQSQLAEIDKQIEELKRSKRFIKRKVMFSTNNELREINSDIIMSHQHKFEVLRVPIMPEKYDYIAQRTILKEILNEKEETKNSIPSRYHVILSKENFLTGEYYSLKYIQLPVSNNDYSIPTSKLEEFDYVSIIHFGKYDTLEISYEKILTYIKENKLKVIGDIFNIPIIDSWFESSEENFVTEVRVPISINNGY